MPQQKEQFQCLTNMWPINTQYSVRLKNIRKFWQKNAEQSWSGFLYCLILDYRSDHALFSG